MTRSSGWRYDRDVKSGPIGAAALALLLFVTTMAPARAEPALYDVAEAPVLNVVLQSGTLTIRTWDRPQIQIEGDGDVQSQHFSALQTERRISVIQNALLVGRTETTAQGTISLPPENVTLPSLGAGNHDGVVVRGQGNTTVTIPAGTALVAARVIHGGIELENYRGGTFVTQVGTGYEALHNVGGVGITQVINGRIVADNSDFSHLRARTLRGNLLFQNCNAREIEVSSVLGSITYHNGTFQPGLARFESTYGNVAIGVNGRAEIGAHSETGQIFSQGNSGDVQRRGQTDAQASFGGGGGPFVTATSARGKVILYSGSSCSAQKVESCGMPPRFKPPGRRGRPPLRL